MVTEKAPETQAERVATIRDIEREAARLAGEDVQQEIIFKDISPQKKKVSLWRITDGREIRIPLYMLKQILGKRNPDGSDIFTGTQSQAAVFKPGTVLCFMHKDSPEQVILAEIGLSASPCAKATLRNNHSKRMHAKHRHKQEWEAYEEYLDDQKEEEAIARQEKQLDATLEIARGASTLKGPEYLDAMGGPLGDVVVEAMAEKVVVEAEEKVLGETASVPCGKGDCTYAGTVKQVRGHQMGKHK